MDGEVVAMRGDAMLPFAELQKRLGRREGDLFMREEVPIRFVAFDLLWLPGGSLLDAPLRERRAALERIAPLPESVRLAHLITAVSPEEIETAFTAARRRRNEGLMIKDPESTYTPGRRGLAWLKLKKAYATLDCVVVGAAYGHGKRAQVLSDYTFAVRDEGTGGVQGHRQSVLRSDRPGDIPVDPAFLGNRRAAARTAFRGKTRGGAGDCLRPIAAEPAPRERVGHAFSAHRASPKRQRPC